jgi:hypothetical protein
MQKTVEVSGDLLAEVMLIARRDGVSLCDVVESALRNEIARRTSEAMFTLRDASFGGDGLQPGFADATWAQVRDAAYKGRGA